MILVDANLLVYAHVGSFAQHAAAREWLDERINGAAPVGLPWPSLLGFVRLVSNPRIFDRPSSSGRHGGRQSRGWLRILPGFRCLPNAIGRYSPRS